MEIKMGFSGGRGRTGSSGRRRINISQFSLVFLFLIEFVLVRGEPAWFQVCNENSKYALNTVDCQLGLWLEKPLKIGCACVNGVWILSSGLCDEDSIVLVGSGDCFSIQEPVQSIKFIGNRDDPFAPASYLVSSDMSSFTRIPESGSGFNSDLDTPSSFILSINPQKAIIRSDDEVCIEPDARNLRSPVHIIKNSRRQSTKFRQVNFGTCDSPESFKYHVGFGETFQSGVVKRVDEVAYDCTSKCVSPPNHKNDIKQYPKLNFGRGIGPILSRSGPISAASQNTSKTDILWSGLYLLRRKLAFIGGYGLSTEQREEKQNIFRSRLEISEPKIVYQRETREQTVRMAQAHTNYLLLNQPTVKVNSLEYTYFQIARRGFLAAVPQDLFPASVVNAITRMWRQLLWESHDKFPYTESSDNKRHDRVKEQLELCLTNVSEPGHGYFFRDKNKNSSHGCFNNTDNIYMNYTGEVDKESVARDGWPIIGGGTKIPKWAKSDFTKYDMVVEVAWKISVMLHYRCARYFKNNPSDHSYFFEKLMSLFNQKVIKRWRNPEESVKVYKMLFNTYDLNELGTILDYVVNFDIEATQIFNYWLERPKVPISFEDIPFREIRRRLKRSRSRSRVNLFWGGRGNCMNTFSDPIQNFGARSSSSCSVSDPDD